MSVHTLGELFLSPICMNFKLSFHSHSRVLWTLKQQEIKFFPCGCKGVKNSLYATCKYDKIMKNTITVCHMMCTLSNLFIISSQLRWRPLHLGRHWEKKYKGFSFWRCQSNWHQNDSSAHSGHDFMNTVSVHKRPSDFSWWRNEDPRMISSKMCLPLELAVFVELPFLITALTGIWQLCTVTIHVTIGG